MGVDANRGDAGKSTMRDEANNYTCTADDQAWSGVMISRTCLALLPVREAVKRRRRTQSPSPRDRANP